VATFQLIVHVPPRATAGGATPGGAPGGRSAGATGTPSPPPAASHRAVATVPGFASVLSASRGRLLALGAVGGLLLPSYLLAQSQAFGALAPLFGLTLFGLAAAVLVRTEGFDRTRLAAVGTADQAAVVALEGAGVATVGVITVAVIVAIFASVLLIAIGLAVLAGIARES
jgi:hypothetical protein